MLYRCYSKKFQEKNPTYSDCYVCERWLKLSNFVEDITKIEGYELWLNNPNKYICLDKDIKSNGKNKCYCLENCMFTTIEENIRQSNKTMDYDFLKGENNYFFGKHLCGTENSSIKKIVQYDLNGNEIRTWDYIKQINEEIGLDCSSIVKCCKFWEMNCNKDEWKKTYKNRPRKSVGGFIWKYYMLLHQMQ